MESVIAPPIKPPRGIKPSKETVRTNIIFFCNYYYFINVLNCVFQSGLLITVIRALSASETNEQREVEKAKLEKDFKRCDQRLDELVSANEEDLTEVMRVSFTDLFSRTGHYVLQHDYTISHLSLDIWNTI